MLEFTITSPHVHFGVDSNIFTTSNPMPESTLTLYQSRLYPPVSDFGFGLYSSNFVHNYNVEQRGLLSSLLFFLRGSRKRFIMVSSCMEEIVIWEYSIRRKQL
jgi:hypothetical protein